VNRFYEGHGRVDDTSVFWRTDPATLRDVVIDRKVLESALANFAPLDRVRFLTLLNREN
jgi:hypothetical protein